MKTPLRLVSAVLALVVVSLPLLAQTPTTPIPVKIVKKGDGFQLLRGGKPYFIKGAGGDGSKTELKAAGANSWRTWGSDNLDGQLAEAQKLGMTVTIGVWLGHKEHGFKYDNADAVAAQKEMARKAILRYRNSPALLVWAFGNEMENGQEDDVNMWNAIEDIAKMSHQLDPNHPTMTVVAEIGGNKVKHINELCPDIDMVGINSYGGGPSVGDRYKTAGGVKPYVITEFGPPGTWESGKNAWGVVPELTSTEKADRYRATYEKGVLAEPMCVGSYAFTWGNKQEASATWYGLRLPDGSHLGPVDTLTELWSGHKPAYLSPVIKTLALSGPGQVAPGGTVQAVLDVSSPQNDPLKVQWVLQADPAEYNVGGGGEAIPPSYPEAIVSSSLKAATLKMPTIGGPYRLYAYVRDTHGGAAVGNLSLDVQGGAAAPPPMARKASLPLAIYSDDSSDTPFIPSGYMGNTAAIKMDPQSTDNPHSGKTALKVSYAANDNWGGVVWQNPDNNWGDKAGGWNLTGAKKLSFWARGDKGGEVVTFSFGLIGSDKPFHDTAKGTTDKVTLTKDWKQYSIDLSGLDLSRIVTGFAWTLGAPGSPVTFYLDDIKYE
ncbi:MAG: hypothetical protein M3Y13_09360 [Armatimonadota bacterium]|nr:hypothetical protein [Armatimonadota bacterium]